MLLLTLGLEVTVERLELLVWEDRLVLVARELVLVDVELAREELDVWITDDELVVPGMH